MRVTCKLPFNVYFYQKNKGKFFGPIARFRPKLLAKDEERLLQNCIFLTNPLKM